MRARVTRRFFLALIGLAAVPPAKSAALAVPAPATVDLLRCPVAGLPYYDYPRIDRDFAAGMRLVLRRQPSNPHDHRAIEVLTEHGQKLGYVPRMHNAVIASLMDAGYEVQAGVAGPDPRGRGQLWTAVRLVERCGASTTTTG